MAARDLERVRGWWVLSGLVPFGFGAPGGFLYAAQRTGRRAWYVAAAVWALIAATGFALAVMSEDDTPLRSLGGAFLLTAWVGGLVHALAVRERYVQLVRGGAGPDPVGSARRRLADRQRAAVMVREQPELARELGVGRPDLPGAQDMGVVDINHASAEAIAAMPGLDAPTAHRLAELRDEVGGFSSAEEAGALLELPPVTVERLDRRAVFLPF